MPASPIHTPPTDRGKVDSPDQWEHLLSPGFSASLSSCSQVVTPTSCYMENVLTRLPEDQQYKDDPPHN